MFARPITRRHGRAWIILAAGLALPAVVAPASAADPSVADIIKALKPAPLTRSMTKSPAAAAESRFIDALRYRTTRSLSTGEREKVASIASTKPSIDLEINFEFNSAVIGDTAEPQVTTLGQALTSGQLKGRTFILAGHTDAKGSDTYNQGLSERRADAVKKYLAEQYGIDEGKLITVGYGKMQLKDTANPFAGENRRVQVVNAAEK
jgi:outer membrane protein OmpA-like peptidoglycan-associated protein